MLIRQEVLLRFPSSIPSSSRSIVSGVLHHPHAHFPSFEGWEVCQHLLILSSSDGADGSVLGLVRP